MDPFTIFVTVVSIISGVASYQQAKKIQREVDRESRGVEANIESNIKAIPVVYGERRVGGTRVYIDTSKDIGNKYLYMVMAMAEGEIEDIHSIEIDDIPITDEKFILSGLGANFTYEIFYGSDTQDASELIIDGVAYSNSADVPPEVAIYLSGQEGDKPWNQNHKLNGVAYLAMRFLWDSNAYNGVPNVTAIVKGKKVYDPRNPTAPKAWSNNPALCIRDYLTSSRYGKGIPESAINDTMFSQAASDYDAFVVTPYDGGDDITLFELNTVIDTEVKIINNLNDMLMSCRGFLPYVDGKYGIRVDKATNHVMDVSSDHIIGGISIAGTKKEDRFNQVKVNFFNKDKEYKEDTAVFPDVDDPSDVNNLYQQYLAEDGGEPLVDDIKIDGISNYYTAREMAKLFLLRSRLGTAIAFRGTSELMELEVGDTFLITQPTPAWTNKKFQVQEIGLNFDGTVNIQAIEYSDEIYTYNTASEETPFVPTKLPNPNKLAPVTALSASAGTDISADGKTISFIDLSWTAPNDALVDRYEIKYTIDDETSVVYSAVAIDQTHRIVDAEGSYDIEVYAVNGFGAKSTGVTLSDVVSITDTTAPSNITSISVVGGLQSISLSWTNPAEYDFDLVRIKVADTNAEPTTHSFEVRSDSFVHDIGAYSTTKHYWLAPVDRTGNVGSYVSGGSATTGSIAISDVPAVAGTFYLTLVDNDAPTVVEFNTAVGRDPIQGDVVVVNKAYFFTRGASAWTAVTEFIDGSLLVSDSVTATEINVTNLSSLSSDLGAITAGSININSGALTIDEDGNLVGTSVTVSGDITANKLTLTGAQVEDSRSSTSLILSSSQLDQSVINLIDTRIEDYGLASSGYFAEDTGGFNNTIPDHPVLEDFAHLNGKNVVIELTASSTWSGTGSPTYPPQYPNNDSSLVIEIQRRVSTETDWTNAVVVDTITNGTSLNTVITGGTWVYGYSSVWFNGLTINYTFNDDPATGTYDYRAFIKTIGTNYTGVSTFYFEANEAGTASGGGVNDYVDSFSINDSTGVITVGRTGALGDLTANISTYVGNQVSALVDSAPATLDTLNELAAALGDDANFSTTMTTALGTKITQADGDARYALNSSVVNTVYQKEMNTSSAGYVSFEFTGYVNTIGRDFYIFDVIGYKDFRDAKSFVHYTVYLNCKGIFGGTLADNTITADVIAHNQSDDANLTFKLERNLTPDNKHKLWIGIDEGYSGIQILHYPTYIGDLTRVSSADFDFTSTAPTTTTVFEPSIPVLSSGATFTGVVTFNGDVTSSSSNGLKLGTKGLLYTYESGSTNDLWLLNTTQANNMGLGVKGNGTPVYYDGASERTLYHTGNFTNNSTQWDTAYGWGNHASAGYLTSLPSHNHDDRYYTETESDSRFVRADNGVTTNNSNLGLVVSSNMSIDHTGNIISKITNDNFWDGHVYSSTGFTGGCLFRYSPTNTDRRTMVGISSDPTANSSYTSIDYCFYIQAGGSLVIYESGASISTGRSYVVGDDLAIIYDNSNIRYYHNNELIRRVSTTSGRTFHFDSSFYDVYSNYTNYLVFEPYIERNDLSTLSILGNEVIDSSRNLKNIASISTSGGISVSGYNSVSAYSGAFTYITGALTGNVVGNVTGNASTATSASNIDGIAFRNGNNTNVTTPDSITGNGTSYVNGLSLLGQTDGALYSQAYSSSWVHQIYGDYRTGNLAVRGKNNGTWQDWKSIFSDTYHPNADKWTSPRVLTLTGDVSGTVTWDGSANASMLVAVGDDSHSHSNYITNNADDTTSGSISTAINKYFGYASTYRYTPYTTGGIGTRSELISAANFLIHADTDGSGTNEFVSIRAGAGTANELKLLSKTSAAGVNNQALTLNGNKVFNDAYHPNADKWTTARTITLGGDLTGSVSIDGSANVTLSAQVTNDSHTHDGRYVNVTGDTMSGALVVNNTTRLSGSSVTFNNLASTGAYNLYATRSSTNAPPMDYGTMFTIGSNKAGSTFATQIAHERSANQMFMRGMNDGVNGWSSWQRLFADNYHPNADKWTTARTITLGGDLTGSVSIDGSANVTLSAQVVNDSHNHDHSDGNFTVNGNLTVTGNVQHTGLTMTSGTDIDQLYTATTSISISTVWQDTGVNGSELSTGTYIVQLYASDFGSGGGHYYEMYSGVMSWYGDNTNNTSADEIALHNAGHAQINNGAIFLRVLRTTSTDVNDLKLQIKATYNRSANSTYTIKFRRMI